MDRYLRHPILKNTQVLQSCLCAWYFFPDLQWRFLWGPITKRTHWQNKAAKVQSWLAICNTTGSSRAVLLSPNVTFPRVLFFFVLSTPMNAQLALTLRLSDNSDLGPSLTSPMLYCVRGVVLHGHARQGPDHRRIGQNSQPTPYLIV